MSTNLVKIMVAHRLIGISYYIIHNSNILDKMYCIKHVKIPFWSISQSWDNGYRMARNKDWQTSVIVKLNY